MKKTLSFFVGVLGAISLNACSGGVPEPKFDNKMLQEWTTAENAAYTFVSSEKCADGKKIYRYNLRIPNDDEVLEFAASCVEGKKTTCIPVLPSLTLTCGDYQSKIDEFKSEVQSPEDLMMFFAGLGLLSMEQSLTFDVPSQNKPQKFSK